MEGLSRLLPPSWQAYRPVSGAGAEGGEGGIDRLDEEIGEPNDGLELAPRASPAPSKPEAASKSANEALLNKATVRGWQGAA